MSITHFATLINEDNAPVAYAVDHSAPLIHSLDIKD